MEDGTEKTTNTGGEILTSLPAAAARLLQEAAATPLDHSAIDPGLKRRKAIDRAHEEVRSRWPNLFRS